MHKRRILILLPSLFVVEMLVSIPLPMSTNIITIITSSRRRRSLMWGSTEVGATGRLDDGTIIDLHELGVGMKVNAINVGLHVHAIDSGLNGCGCNQCRARYGHKWLGC